MDFASQVIFKVCVKNKMQFKRLDIRKAQKQFWIICDQDILLTGINSRKRYPEKLRRIKFYDSEYDRTFIF